MVSFVDDRVRLMAGGRFQRIAQYSYDYNTGDPLSGYDKKTVTPAVGLVVKPTRQVSLYANYIEALVQGDVVPLVSGGVQIRNHDEIFAPFRSRQYEVGAKYDSGTIGGTLALFRVNKPSALVVGDVYTHDGEQRNQGIELSWYGEAARDLNILGGITILDAKVLESQGGLLDGRRITGVPDVQANLGLEWGVPLVRCLTLDGHLVYTGSESADGANTTGIPASTRLDLGGRYGFTFADKLVTVRGSVENVTDKDYWASVGGEPGANYLVLAEPRTIKLSLSVDL
jgi:iron complex outermembrane receptor protein